MHREGGGREGRKHHYGGQVWDYTAKSKVASGARHPHSERYTGGPFSLRLCLCLPQTGAAAKVLGVSSMVGGALLLPDS